MNPTVLFRKLKRNYVDHGLRTTITKSVRYLLKTVYDRQTYRIYMIDLTGHRPLTTMESEFGYKMIDMSDVNLINQVEALEEWLIGRVNEKLVNGGVCLVALDGDTVAGFNLVGFGRVEMPLVNTYRDFGRGNAWSEQITVNSKYRGKGLGADLRYNIFTELHKMGIRKFYGGTLSDNEPNLKLTRKVGFKEIADIRYSRTFTESNWSCNRVRHPA
jgi:L-amino acid N-acyltransferase YncA